MKSLTNYILEAVDYSTFKTKKEIFKTTEKFDISDLDSDGKEHGFEYVDLGLPSGTKWATCNVGADTPADDGLLFQWGRVEGYKYGDNNNNFGDEGKGKKYYDWYVPEPVSGSNYGLNKILKPEDDAAHENMGGKWRMPTPEELEELSRNTTQRLVKIRSKRIVKRGILATSKINDKSIFIPFDGYWNSSTKSFDKKNEWVELWASSTAKRYYDNYDKENSTHSLKLFGAFDDHGQAYFNDYVGEAARDHALSVRGVFK